MLAVIRRGPSGWSHLGRWDLAQSRYESGAWIRGNLYPQRCDLSPDGRWFCYFTLRGRATWKAGNTYIAISRLPWLTALAAWGTCGTWTSGLHFVEDREIWRVGPPDEGDVEPCRRRFGLAVTRPAAFAVERRRGWTETADSPHRPPGDMWDESRVERLRMEKARPGSGGATRLVASGGFAAFRVGPANRWGGVHYQVMGDSGPVSLDDVQWADWDGEGRLLVATRDGRLQVREWARDRRAVRWEASLSDLAPAPTPPPREAVRW